MKILFLITFLYISQSAYSNPKNRIVSTLPSITEMIYFLGAQDQLVGVTAYCKYPLAAKEKPSIGSAFSLNYEKLVKLRPSLVLLAPIKGGRVIENLSRLKIDHTLIPYERFHDVKESLIKINNVLKLGKRKVIDNHFTSVKNVKRVDARVLIVISEKIDNGLVKSVRIAGNETFYGDILKKIGGINAYDKVGVSYPKLDLERIMKLKFDYILRVGEVSLKSKDIKELWKSTQYSQKTRFIFEDYAVVPGPRIIDLYRKMSDVLNAKN